MVRTFIDTNVLIYADDLDAGEKREQAREVLGELLGSRQAVLSTQVLQEFYVVSTRKLGVDPTVARRKVELLAQTEVIEVRSKDVLAAIDLSRLHSVSFWDALIVRAAQVGACRFILSEDLQRGRDFDGTEVVDPFADPAPGP